MNAKQMVIRLATICYYTTVIPMNRPSIWDYLPQPEKDCIPPQDREDRQVYTGYWIYYNRDGSVLFGTETREYFGILPAEIARAVPESVINCIACIVFEAHRSGRREAYTYLKEFVLEKLEPKDKGNLVKRLPCGNTLESTGRTILFHAALAPLAVVLRPDNWEVLSLWPFPIRPAFTAFCGFGSICTRF